MEKLISKINNEICNECGKSVKFGTGLFVNRVFDFNSEKDRKEFGKPFPKGDFICPICEENIQSKFQENYVGNKRITD